MDVVNVDFILNLFTWKDPGKSALYLVIVNVFCWFLQRQRPVYVISLFILSYYLTVLWKRIRHEVLVDPPDREDWANLSYYDMEKTIIEHVKSIWTSWIRMRKNNYYMWIILTSLFWIALAKIGSVVSFVTILFLFSNGGFIAGPLFKTFPVELLEPTSGDDDFEDSQMTSVDQRDSTESFLTPSSLLAPSSWGRLIQDKLLKTFDSAMRSSSPQSNNESSTSMETEPFIAQTTSLHGSDSSDEFLFDADHFESSSSSTSNSNSFELIHF